MRTLQRARADAARAASAAKASYYPVTTIKCNGPAVFRSQVARDVACLLDVDAAVSTWQCQPKRGRRTKDAPDFLVSYFSGDRHYLDAPDRKAPGVSHREQFDAEYRRLSHEEVYGSFRLQNAKDLLRYGKWHTTLGDRVRLLAALDEYGSLTLTECLGAFQETKPVAGIASLILSGFLEVDLDTALIGPETTVRRIRP